MENKNIRKTFIKDRIKQKKQERNLKMEQDQENGDARLMQKLTRNSDGWSRNAIR